MAERFTIGELAQAAGLSVDTVRYYEKEGLLPAPIRRANGYRAFQPEAVERLAFIQHAKEMGFSLREIHELLHLQGDDAGDAADYHQVVQEKLAQIEAKLADLQRLRDALRQLLAACPGEGPSATCPIARALSPQSFSKVALTLE